MIRYFLRKLKKVKKSNGQMLAINEVLSLLDVVFFFKFYLFFLFAYADDYYVFLVVEKNGEMPRIYGHLLY